MTATFALATAPLDAGTTLLEASAGTGKTYALTGLVLRLLLEGRVEDVTQVLVVTFTVAATEELKTRLRAGLLRAAQACAGAADPDPFFQGLARHGADGRRRLLAALGDFDRVAVHTIHGFCKRLLEEAAFESGTPFTTDFVEDEIPLLRAAAEDALRQHLYGGDELAGAALHATAMTPTALVHAWRAWRRHPDTAIAPPSPPLDTALPPLAAALQACADAWTPATADSLCALDFKKGKSPFGANAAAAVPRLGTDLQADPLAALSRLLALGKARGLVKKASEGRVARDPFLVACAALHAAHELAVHALRTDLLLAMDARLATQKLRSNERTFQDLVAQAHAALADPERRRPLLRAVQQRWRAALIDEFQDTDRLQYEVFAHCFAGRPLFLIGDPKQSIYAFRGADVHAYLEVAARADQRPSLDTNWRSSPELVAAVQALFARPRPFVDAAIALPPVHAAHAAGELDLATAPARALCWRLVPAPPQDDKRLPGQDQFLPLLLADLCGEVVRLLQQRPRWRGRPLRAGDIAVLTRKNVQALAVQDALRRAGVHSAIGRAGDIFESEEMEEMARLLRALLDPQRLPLAKAAFATRLWGCDAAALHALDTDEAQLERALQLLDRCRQLWRQRGIVVAVERLFAERAVRPRLLARHDGERRLTNALQVLELLHRAEHRRQLSPEALLEWLRHEREQSEDIDYRERELRLESDADAVQILTAHGSKGLQFPVVFCPFLWDGRGPERGHVVVRSPDGGRALWFARPEGDHAAETPEDDRLAEDLRLCYVALTRAEGRCYVHVCGATNAQHSALAWLLGDPLRASDSVGSWRKRQDADAVRLWPDRLHALVAANPDRMHVHAVPADTAPPVPLERTPAPGGRPLPLPPRATPAWRLTSFTALTETGAAAAGADAVAFDLDPGPADDPRGDPAAARRSEVPRRAPAEAATGRFAFARGAAAGQCLHAILEHADLAQVEAPATAALVQRQLAAAGLAEASAHDGTIDAAATVHGLLRDLAAAVVPDTALPFATLCAGPRRAEWPFQLHLGPAATLAGLADVLARHGSDVARAYAGRLRELPSTRLHGFLVGFVDLVACHGDRYWLLDWKSNHLGDDAAAYGPPAVAADLQAHDYVLQYHLYALALHRHLAARQAAYDPARHFGGAVYVYLRGVRPGSGNGCFVDRPSPALLAALDTWARGGAS